MTIKNHALIIVIPNLGRGGAQQVFRDQLAFYSRHYRTFGCVFNWDDAFENDMTLNVISLNVAAGNSTLTKLLFFILRIYRLARLKRKLNATLCISHLEGADYINVLSGGNTICWIHGTKIHDQQISGKLGWIRTSILIPFLYKRAKHLICVSDGIKNELTSIFKLRPAKIMTIVNGLYLEKIRVNKQADSSPYLNCIHPQNKILITHCRLSPQKNLKPLLDIFSKTNDQFPSKLLILGDGELRNELLEHSLSKGLKTFHPWGDLKCSNDYDVYFVGHQFNPYPFLTRASLYVMTSKWEGYPLSLCEAMACGLPVIASDCYTGPREILGNDIQVSQPIPQPLILPTGVLMPLPEGDSASQQIWVNLIVQILRNEDELRSMSIRAKARATDFDYRKVEANWLRLISK